MPSSNRWAALLLTTCCAGGVWAAPTKPGNAMGLRQMASDAPTPLDAPYTVGSVTYTPVDPAYYDEVGYAGVVQDGGRGGDTTSGEAFVPAAITAAHKTLPLPSYIEVTALDTGRTILVRVNDRGPMRNDLLLALSPGAVAQIGAAGERFPVRVRRVNPPEQERVLLRSNARAAERLETPPALLKALRARLPATPPAKTGIAASRQPAPVAPVVAKPVPRPGVDFEKPTRATTTATSPVATPSARKKAAVRAGGYVVQIGAFSSRSRAEAIAKQAGAQVVQGENLWRVRLGPYPTQQAAQAGVRAAAAKGFEIVRVMANDGR